MTKVRPKVSVVVPIYNVEAFIERCAVSLFEQTLDELEYIFVNDCTPDGSVDVLRRVVEEYPDRKPNVKILENEKNLGGGHSRNRGIEASQGEYIAFCDSDDYVELDMYESLYHEAVATGSEIVACNLRCYQKDNKFSDTRCFVGKDGDWLKALLNLDIKGYPFDKLFKRSLIVDNGLQFPPYQMIEDLVFCVEAFYYSRKCTILNRVLYHYAFNNCSVCNTRTEEALLRKSENCIRNVLTLIDFFKKNGVYDKYKRELAIWKFKAKAVIWPLAVENPSKYRKYWLTTFQEVNYYIPFMKGVAFRFKIYYLLNLIGIYPLLKKIFVKHKIINNC